MGVKGRDERERDERIEEGDEKREGREKRTRGEERENTCYVYHEMASLALEHKPRKSRLAFLQISWRVITVWLGDKVVR